MSSKERLTQAIINLDEQMVTDTINKMIASNVELTDIIEACRDGMTVIGELFEKGDYFLSEMVMASELLTDIISRLKKKAERSYISPLGTVVIGTVKGDIHYIGKDIVVNVLEANGYQVIDLGVDVSPEKFVEAIITNKPEVVGLSGLITEAIGPMKKTVDAIKAAGLRDKVKIIIGGGIVNEVISSYVGADKWANNVSTGLKEINAWAGEKNVRE